MGMWLYGTPVIVAPCRARVHLRRTSPAVAVMGCSADHSVTRASRRLARSRGLTARESDGVYAGRGGTGHAGTVPLSLGRPTRRGEVGEARVPDGGVGVDRATLC